jgi:hypothetical protein
MSMFDWQADAKPPSSESTGGTEVVSRRFWIYWLISLPLTIVVLLTWRTWWHREKTRYRQKYPHVKLDPDIGSIISNRLRKLVWRQKEIGDIEKLE